MCWCKCVWEDCRICQFEECLGYLVEKLWKWSKSLEGEASSLEETVWAYGYEEWYIRKLEIISQGW